VSEPHHDDASRLHSNSLDYDIKVAKFLVGRQLNFAGINVVDVNQRQAELFSAFDLEQRLAFLPRLVSVGHDTKQHQLSPWSFCVMGSGAVRIGPAPFPGWRSYK